MSFRGDNRARHAPPRQTRAQTRLRLITELTSCTDAALAGKSAEAMHRGSYSSLPLVEIVNLLAAEREKRTLTPEERFAAVMAQGVGVGVL